MDDAVKQLKAFAVTCSHDSMHKEDWLRLYTFAVYVHQNRLGLEAEWVKQQLIDFGCSRQRARYLSGEYAHFIRLLALYDQQRASPDDLLFH